MVAVTRPRPRRAHDRLRIATLALTAACASCAGARVPVRVAVLPVEHVTDTATAGVDSEGLVAAALAARGGIEVIDRARTSEAAAAAGAACPADPLCLRGLAGALGADRTVSTRVAALGTTVVVRASLAEAGTPALTRQEVLREATPTAVAGAMERLGAELAEAIAPRRRWYRRWWVWAVAGAVVAGGVTTAAVLASRDDERGPDVIITPP
jgi:hypothetical protein